MGNSPQIYPTFPGNRCDVCGAIDWRQLFATSDRLCLSAEQFSIIECTHCKVWRTLPEMSEEELGQFYPNDYWGGEPTEEWIQASQSDKTNFINQCRLEGGRILDLGCGAGFFLHV